MNYDEGKEEDVNIIELNTALVKANVEYYKSLIVHQIYINKYWRLKSNRLRLTAQAPS